MPTPEGNERRLVRGALTDEWQRIEDLYDALGPLIPPGRALRAREEGVKPVSEFEQLRAGRRFLLRVALRGLRRSNLAEVRTDHEGVRWARRAPFELRKTIPA